MNPKISVVMAVYNGEKYLKQAIESILNQTFKDFEFLIISDGSTDKSLEIIKSYQSDNRIRILDNIENKGLIYSLNRGIKQAKGTYIARMDADDISYGDRLEKQFDFMEKNRGVELLGSGMDIMLEGVPFLKKRIFAEGDYEKIKVELLFRSVFFHPSVMIRREFLNKNDLLYEEKYKNAEDYGLWTDIVLLGKCKNMKEALIKYRIVKRSVTRTANQDINSRKEIFKRIYANYFEKLSIEINNYELDLHFECCMIQNIRDFEYSVHEKEKYLINLKNKLKEKNFNYKIVDDSIATIAQKIYIYQLGDINEINRELFVSKKVIKKIKLIENIKKQIKKSYK